MKKVLIILMFLVLALVACDTETDGLEKGLGDLHGGPDSDRDLAGVGDSCESYTDCAHLLPYCDGNIGNKAGCDLGKCVYIAQDCGDGFTCKEWDLPDRYDISCVR